MWLLWVQEAMGNHPSLSMVVENWAACLHHACLVLSWATQRANPKQVDKFVYRFFGLALAVLMAHRPQKAASDTLILGSLFRTCQGCDRGARTRVGNLLLLCRARTKVNSCGRL